MSKQRVVLEAMTFRVAAQWLDVTTETIRQWTDAGTLEEAFLPGTEGKSGRYRLVTCSSVEKLRKARAASADSQE